MFNAHLDCIMLIWSWVTNIDTLLVEIFEVLLRFDTQTFLAHATIITSTREWGFRPKVTFVTEVNGVIFG